MSQISSFPCLLFQLPKLCQPWTMVKHAKCTEQFIFCRHLGTHEIIHIVLKLFKYFFPSLLHWFSFILKPTSFHNIIHFTIYFKHYESFWYHKLSTTLYTTHPCGELWLVEGWWWVTLPPTITCHIDELCTSLWHQNFSNIISFSSPTFESF